uniref:Uncharacterized protein n=1 Tax=Quercus lobata TaxID=97700 RepID=A0A7N2LD16_QUELO
MLLFLHYKTDVESKLEKSGKGTCITSPETTVVNYNGLVSGAGGAPVTLAEFTLDSPEDYYDVCLVDG